MAKSTKSNPSKTPKSKATAKAGANKLSKLKDRNLESVVGGTTRPYPPGKYE